MKLLTLRRALIVALLIATAPFAGALPTALASIDRDDVPVFYENALRLFEDGAFDDAVIELRNVLQADPSHLPARLLIGRAYLRLGNPRSAETALHRARELGIDEDHVLGPLALSYLMQGKYEDLLAEIPSGGRSIGSRADVLVARGMAYLELRQWDEAGLSFELAAELLPDDPAPVIGHVRALLTQGRSGDAETLVEARRDTLFEGGVEAWYWYVKGEASRLRGEPGDAAAYYDEALALNPDHLAAIVGRAAARIDSGDDPGALTDLERAYALMPNEPQVAYLYALMQAETGDQDAARSVLAAAGTPLANLTLEEMREHPPTLLMASIVSYNQGLLNQAEAYLSRYVVVRPHHVAARKFLGRVRLVLGDPSGAVAALEPARQAAPEDVELMELLGDGYLRLNRFAEALATFEGAVGETSRPAAVQTGMAVGLMGLGQASAAREALETALAADPTNDDAALLLAMMHLEQRRFDMALEVAERLTEMDPETAVGNNLAGGALFGLGREEEARARFELAVATQPDFYPAHANLARLDAHVGLPERAVERHLAILADNPGEVRSMLALSRLAEDRGDLGQAIEWHERYLGNVADAAAEEVYLVGLYLAAGQTDLALALAADLRRRDGDNFVFREAEARTLMAAGRTREATDALRSMSNYIAERAGQFTRVAHFQLEIGDLEGARQSLDDAIEVDPAYAPARAQLARLEIGAGNRTRALAIAQDLQRQLPESAIGDLLVGDILMAAADHAGAARAYASAMDKAGNTELAWRLYRARDNAGDADQALADLEAWSAGRPADYAAQRALAVAYLQQGLTERAITAHEALLADQPDDLVLINNLAVLYLQADDPRAMAYAERAYALAPHEPAAIDTLGWILVQQGDAERGLPLLREAHARAGDNLAIRYHIAEALSRLGRTEAARSELEAVLGAGREFDGIDDARRLLEALTGS